MISKERLEELIEQGATIYELYMNKNILEIQLKTDWFVMQDGLYERKLSKHPFRSWQIGNLYETKEDAEFVREFGCIERTERLELPTWEEGKAEHCKFNTPNGSSYLLTTRIMTGYSIEKENPYIIRIQKLGECESFIDFEYTKENYTLACRKAKELFLGNNDQNAT